METKIKEIITKIIQRRQGVIVKPSNDSKLVADLGLDSLDHVILLCEIEEEFLIKIPKKFNTYTYTTVQDVIDVAYQVKDELYGHNTGTK